jgi:hypothetical protein
MTRLPPIVTAGKARDRHNHAAILAAAGRTWSVPHRRGKIWVQAKAAEIPPEAICPRRAESPSTKVLLRQRLIKQTQPLDDKRFLETTRVRLQAPSQDLGLIPFSTQTSKIGGVAQWWCLAAGVHEQERARLVFGILEKNALAQPRPAGSRRPAQAALVISHDMVEANRQVRPIVLSQASGAIE